MTEADGCDSRRVSRFGVGRSVGLKSQKAAETEPAGLEFFLPTSSPLDEDGVPATQLSLLATRLRRVSEQGASLPDICPTSAATRACPPRVATPRAPPDEPVPSHLRSRPRARHRLGSRFCRIEAAPAPVPANASLGRIPRVDNTICIFDKNFFLGFFFRTEHRTPITRRSTRHERGDKPHRSSRFLKSQGVGSSRPGCKKISEVETNRFEPIAIAFAT